MAIKCTECGASIQDDSKFCSYCGAKVPEEAKIDVKKREYAEIVRATLSPYELVFLYYIGFSHPRFKVLIEKYTLLNNLRPFLLAASGERDLVAKKFENDYTYEMDMDIDETNEYRKTAFKKNKGV